MSTNGSSPTFESFGLRQEILKGVAEAGFTIPSPIQQQAIPHVMAGRDVIAQAQTGTGKTAAFGLPVMDRVSGSHRVEILVIVPTRELASQVSDEMYRLGRFANIRTVAVYGGESISRQVKFVNRGAQVVVATPGRLLDHLQSGRLQDFHPSVVILDEADEMLDMGFIEDIEAIFEYLPTQRQTLLFSATIPPAIRALAAKILTDPVWIDVTPKELKTNSDIRQRYYVVEDHEREEALVRLLDTEAPTKALVFCRTKKEADALCTTLISRGYAAKALHGDMEQPQREEAIEAFRKGRIELLIATDVAARGLDITDISHVFNYHMPFGPDGYIHRIGRTGRAGKQGIAITFVTPSEYRDMTRIMKVSGASIVYEQIPTIREARTNYRSELLASLQRQPVHEDAVTLVENLLDDMDTSEIAYRALSMLLDQRKIEGPNRIGFSTRDLERLMVRLQQNKSKKKPHKSPFKKRPYRQHR
jgi:ATP-dependent RNA helicase DeaD